MAGPLIATSPDAGRQDRLLGPDGRPISDDDGFLIPHYRTFAAVWNALSRVYRYTWDEALKNSAENALAMRRDSYIRSLLQERYLAVVSLPWHLEADDPKDEEQKDAAEQLTAVCKQTPRYNQFKLNLLDAIWYGRYGSQVVVGEQDVQGEQRQCVLRHLPVNGDKIQFDFDGHPAVFVNPTWAAEYRQRMPEESKRRLVPNDRLPYGDRAPMLRLDDPAMRERFVIHQHVTEDADYFDGEMAGGVHGVGLRHLLYWSWWMRDEMLSWMLSYMQKVGSNGIMLFYFPDGNAQAKAAAEAAARSSSTKTAFAVPVPAGAGGRQQAGAEVIPASTAGTEQLHSIISDYFERHMERLTVGQSMSSGGGAKGGLEGDGRAEFAADTKWQIVKFDAENLAETLTEDHVRPLQRLNFPAAKFKVHYRVAVPDPDADKKVANAKLILDMGLAVKEDEVRAAAGFSKPEPDDEVIQLAGEQVEFDENGDPIEPEGGDDGKPRAREASGDPGEKADFAADDGDGRWITIGSNKSAPKGEKGGTPVYVAGGKIVKGPAGLVNKGLDGLKRRQKKESDADRNKDILAEPTTHPPGSKGAEKVRGDREKAGLPADHPQDAGPEATTKKDAAQNWADAARRLEEAQERHDVELSQGSYDALQKARAAHKEAKSAYDNADGDGDESDEQVTERLHNFVADEIDRCRTQHGGNAEAYGDYHRATYNVVERLTPAARKLLAKNLKGIEFYPNLDGLRGEYAKAAGAKSGVRPLAYWHGKQGKLHLDGGGLVEGTYAHEVAHAVDNACTKNVGGDVGWAGEFSGRPEWVEAFRAEIDVDGNPLTGNDYARKNVMEGWAEFGRKIHQDKGWCRRNFPKCFAFWEANGLA